MGRPRYINDVLTKLYREIYLGISNKTIHCFLCGAQKDKHTKISTRELLKGRLEKKNSIKVIYAEDLFTVLVDNKNKYDYLSLENLLAEDSDIIVIILESVGSFVEFGAFVNRDNLRDKVIALMEESHKDDESFLALGPIKHIKGNRKKSVIYFKDVADDDTVSDIKSSIKDYYDKSPGITHANKITSILTLYYFLPIYFGIFSPITFKEILEHIKYISGEFVSDLDDRLQSALYLLYKENIVVRDEGNDKFYVLTQHGYDLMNNTISNNKHILGDKNLFDKLRLSILNSKLRYQYDTYKNYYI